MNILKGICFGVFIALFSSNAYAIDSSYEWGKTEFSWAYSNKIISPEEKLDINDDLSRGKFISMLYKLKGVSEETNNINTFLDIPLDNVYYDAINWAFNKNIVYGVSNEKFDPQKTITREDMVTILNRYAKENNIAYKSQLDKYIDTDQISDYALNPFGWAVKNNIIYGYPSDTLKPRENSTVSQGLAILMRYEKLNSKNVLKVKDIKEATIINGKTGIISKLNNSKDLKEIERKLNEFKIVEKYEAEPVDGYSYSLKILGATGENLDIIFYGDNSIRIGNNIYINEDKDYFKNIWEPIFLFPRDENIVAEIKMATSGKGNFKVIKDKKKIKKILEKLNSFKYIEKEKVIPKDGWEHLIKIKYSNTNYEDNYYIKSNGIEAKDFTGEYFFYKSSDDNFYDSIWKDQFN